MKTIIIGLGNSILTDDSIGPKVAKEIRGRINSRTDIKVIEASVGGLALADLMEGFCRAIIIDAIQTNNGKPGSIYRINENSLHDTLNSASPHDMNLATAIEFGKRMGMALPEKIDILAVEVADVTTFSESCTPDVEKAIPICANLVMESISGGDNAQSGIG